MCTCTRHKWVNLPPEFCKMWEEMEAVQNKKNAELTELKYKNGSIIKAYKEYRTMYKLIVQKWQLVYEPMWDRFDDKFNRNIKGGE